MAARDFPTRLTRRAHRAGLFLDQAAIEKLDAFFALLSRWNQKINLTSLTDPDEAIDRLFLEPLLAVRHVPPGAGTLIDVGSGGGSPAIPFKVALPHLHLTMVEAKARKAAFLSEATRQLQLTDTRVETARAEELLTRADLHEAFAVLSLRAVRVETRVLRTLQAFLAPDGMMLLFRGASGPDALQAIVPPLEWVATYPLIDAMQSRITILTKRRVGHERDVPRGTSPTAQW